VDYRDLDKSSVMSFTNVYSLNPLTLAQHNEKVRTHHSVTYDPPTVPQDIANTMLACQRYK
jgi:hypothetical protein